MGRSTNPSSETSTNRTNRIEGTTTSSTTNSITTSKTNKTNKTSTPSKPRTPRALRTLATHAITGLAAGAVIVACAGAGRPAHHSAAGMPLVVGTFDSRSLAIAYANSEAFERPTGELTRQHEAALAAGDTARAAELEAQGRALQDQLHAQGFSTAPVDDIVALIRDELPSIARTAGVDVIVSRWDVVYQARGAETVDVTEPLVRALQPDAQGLKWALDVRDVEPVPASELPLDY